MSGSVLDNLAKTITIQFKKEKRLQFLSEEELLTQEISNLLVEIGRNVVLSQGYDSFGEQGAALKTLIQAYTDLQQEKALERQKSEPSYCLHCGTAHPSWANYCPKCGTETTHQTRQCSGCGQEITFDACFCKNCGTKQV